MSKQLRDQRPRHQPSTLPTMATAAGRAVAAEIAPHANGANINVQINFADNINQLNVQQRYNHTAPTGCGSGGEEGTAPVLFQANDPQFHPALSSKGVDVGYKWMNLRYKAERMVFEQCRMITYTQCPSTAQTVSHAATANLSHKRTKHFNLFFDCQLDEDLQSKFPSTIYFHELKSVIRRLGGAYECRRKKYPTKNFTVYLYIIKRCGVKLSKPGLQAWGNLLIWGDGLLDTITDNDIASMLSSAEMLGKIAGILVNAAAVAL